MTDDRRSANTRMRTTDDEARGRAEPVAANIWKEIDGLRGDAVLIAPDDPPPEDVVF